MKPLFEFFSHIREKKIIILGLNGMTEELINMFPWRISYFIDVDGNYVGQTLKDKPIFSPEILIKENLSSIAIIISGSYNPAVVDSLDSIGLRQNRNYWFGANLLEWTYHQRANSQQQEDILQIIMVDGGLASQMNKYAIGRILETRLNVRVKYDLSWFTNCGMDTQNKENRLFSLSKYFNLKINAATEEEIKTYKAFYYYNPGKVYNYDENLLNEVCSRYIDGYLSNCRYFLLRENELKKEFGFQIHLNKVNKDFKKKILAQNNSIAIHVRRGDYIGSIHEVVTIDYYNRAIRSIIQMIGSDDIHFFVFSNDMEWVRNAIHIQNPVTFVDCNSNDDGGIDMYLMSLCKHFILSNSGFGFWAAFLGEKKEKIVITPNKWFNTSSPKMNERLLALIEGHDSGAAIPPNWISLKV